MSELTAQKQGEQIIGEWKTTDTHGMVNAGSEHRAVAYTLMAPGLTAEEELLNAKLIAAAPNMYKAIKVLINGCASCRSGIFEAIECDDPRAHLLMRAALVKAEGIGA